MAIVKVTRAAAEQAIAETDWAAQDALTDEDIARQVSENPDAAPILTTAQTVAAMARTIRKRLELSQEEFAARYDLSVGTLRDWEQARKQPDRTALAYLRVIAKEPLLIAQALGTMSSVDAS